jgi:hypothetical protein
MPETEAAVAHGARAVAEDALEAAEDLAEIFFMWILPLILTLVGIFVVNQIGLSGAIGTAFSELTSFSQSGVVLVADLIAAGIWGGVGATLWAFSGSTKVTRKDGFSAAWIMRPIAGLFTGFAIGELLNALAGKVGNGSIGSAVSTLETKVGGLARGG